jgi:hypothetical protein
MQVLTFDEAAKRATLTRRSLERLFAVGEGPTVITLGKRRCGVLDVDLDHWLMSRCRPAPGEPEPATQTPEHPTP